MHPPISVVSRGGWVFAMKGNSDDSKPSDGWLARGALPPHCKVNGAPALLLEYDRQAGIFEAQGLGRGWPPGTILELQPLYCDGESADALYDKVEYFLWELESMGLVRTERQGTGGGAPSARAPAN